MISVEHLTKRYGSFTAVNDLSFEIDEGHVYGFLGPNGAGKTTTMNIMTGCLSATEGRVRIDGHDIFEEPAKAKKLIGYLPEQPPLYMAETPEEYLQFVGEAKGLRGEVLKQQVADVMEQTKIREMSNRRISALSKGYKQRVGIAQALLGNPRVIILDEPTVGLDPIQIIEIRALIKELGKTHTVIFSSHILSEVQTICDQILIIAKGKLIAFDGPEQMEKRLLAFNEIQITADLTEEEIKEILAETEHISGIDTETKDTGLTVAHLRTDYDNIYEVSGLVFSAFAAKGKVLLEMALIKANLEDVFIELTEGNTDEEAARGIAEGTIEETSAKETSDEAQEAEKETEKEADEK